MKIYNVIVNDRHCEPFATPFLDEQKAINHAKFLANDYCNDKEDLEENENPDWCSYYACYSCEGDAVWITEHEVEENGNN